MSVAFASVTPGSETVRAYQRVIENALALMRPGGEDWAVTLAESESTLRLDLARGTDAPRSLTVATDGDDDRHSQAFRSVCRFVWTYWPSAKRPS